MPPLRFEARVTTGDIIHFVMIVVAGVSAYFSLDARVGELERQRATDARISVAERDIRANKEATDRLEARTLASLDEIKQALRRIEGRLAED